jgi:hypothetical protein
MPFASGKFHAQTAASLGCPKRPRALLGWYNGHEENCVPPSTPVTASAIPWWLWHPSWSCFEKWHICGEGHSRTLRHDWHRCPALQWSELSQDVLAMDSAIWVACALFYALVNFYSSLCSAHLFCKSSWVVPVCHVSRVHDISPRADCPSGAHHP